MRALSRVILFAAASAAAFCGCDGGGNGGQPDADVDVFFDPVEDGVEIPSDVDAALDPLDEDAPLTDTADVPAEDIAVEEIIITPGEGQPYQCETAGGALLESDNYKLEVFIAPVRPVGNLSSPNYKLKLGPASTREP
jgi:hypothetical protein